MRTRLEAHRDNFVLHGVRGPLLRVTELDGDELNILNSSFFERIRSAEPTSLDEMYAAYVGTLHEWGIMCPHPQEHRSYEGASHAESRWYDCRMCKTSVINR